MARDIEKIPPARDRIFEERHLIARLYRSDLLGEGSRARTSIEFDGIDSSVSHLSELALYEQYGDKETEAFALVRTMTTARRFEELTGELPTDGAWFHLELTREKRQDSIPCWHAQLTENGYTTHTRCYMTARFLFSDGDIKPRTLGAAAVQTHAPERKVAKSTDVFDGAPTLVVFAQGGIARKVIVRDVGQASFVSILDAKGSTIFHYDCGWPISYNQHTNPKTMPSIEAAPVLLSHWDWDHMHGYYKFPNLRDVPWFVPRQSIGPGAARVAKQLLDKGCLNLIDPSAVFCGNMVYRMPGAPADANQSGLLLQVQLGNGERVLLVGDADYTHLAALMGSYAYNYLQITHHGAHFNGTVPSPTGAGRAAISVGRKNIYRHPKKTAWDMHWRWKIETTMSGTTGKRADITFP